MKFVKDTKGQYMLTILKTPRILIPHVYAPDTFVFDHNRGDRGTSTRFSLGVEIDAETEADLPDYIRERVSEVGWHGIPKGTRFLSVSSGGVRPAIFGVSTDDLLRSRAINVDLDQMLRYAPATLCISKGVKKGQHAGVWPILRAVYIQSVSLPLPGLQGFHAYVEDRAPHWEFSE